MMDWFKRDEPTIRFVTRHGAPNAMDLTNIQLASNVRPKWFKDQREVPNKDKFANCPGMMDMMQAGYIVPAWADIHIKANRAGVVATVANNYEQMTPMNDKLIAAQVQPDSDVKPFAMKFPAPWALFAKPGYSALVLPATYHSPFLRDLYVPPGIVDYDTLPTINFICMAMRAGEFHIPAGTPLLQVIPYKRDKLITASRGPATRAERDKINHGFAPVRAILGAYRKYCWSRKQYSIKDRDYE